MKHRVPTPFLWIISYSTALLITAIVIIAIEMFRVWLRNTGVFEEIPIFSFLIPSPYLSLLSGISIGLFLFGFQKLSLRTKKNVNSLVDYYALENFSFLLTIKMIWIAIWPYFIGGSFIALITYIFLIMKQYHFLIYFNFPAFFGLAIPSIITYPEWKKIYSIIEEKKSKEG